MRAAALAILAFIPLSPLSARQDETGEAYYKFKVGTAWTYDLTVAGQKTKAAMIVARVEKDRVTVNMEDYEKADSEKPRGVQSLGWYVKDGILWFGPDADNPRDPDAPVYKIGARKGETWSVAVGDGADKKELKGSVEDFMELTVPAGTYKDVLHTKLKMGPDDELDFFLAPKVGMIKMQVGPKVVVEVKEIGERKDVKVAPSARITANERVALGCVKTIATAEADFRANDRDGNKINDFWVGDVSGLYRINPNRQPIKLISKELAEADAAPLDLDLMAKHTVDKPKPYSGYLYRAIAKNPEGKTYGELFGSDKYHNLSEFGVCAYPAEYGRSGLKTFILNETNAIHWKDTGGKSVEQYPTDAELEKDWRKPD